jgi:hypothetical protein
MAQPLKAIRKSNILKRIFSKPFRSYLLENKYKVEPAFELGGIRYFQFANQEDVSTGRQFAALAIYNEMDMRVDREYLELHCKAFDKVVNNGKNINVSYLVQMNNNLRDRLELMVTPGFIYKLASVVFFDESESPYNYDYRYNEKKIEKWKSDPATLDFFLQTPLKNLVPFLTAQEGVSNIFSAVAEQVGEIHHKLLTDILSEKE